MKRYKHLEVARLLGVTEHHLRRLRDRLKLETVVENRIHTYTDEQIDQLCRQLGSVKTKTTTTTPYAPEEQADPLKRAISGLSMLKPPSSQPSAQSAGSLPPSTYTVTIHLRGGLHVSKDIPSRSLDQLLDVLASL